jgi:hypothetical protein
MSSYVMREAQGEEGEPSWLLGILRGNQHFSNNDVVSSQGSKHQVTSLSLRALIV